MTTKESALSAHAKRSAENGKRMNKPSDAKQLARLRRLAAMPDDLIDTSDLPVVEDWSRGVRGGTPSDIRRSVAAGEADDTRNTRKKKT
jgi:hypothetical protein